RKYTRSVRGSTSASRATPLTVTDTRATGPPFQRVESPMLALRLGWGDTAVGQLGIPPGARRGGARLVGRAVGPGAVDRIERAADTCGDADPEALPGLGPGRTRPPPPGREHADDLGIVRALVGVDQQEVVDPAPGRQGLPIGVRERALGGQVLRRVGPPPQGT